MRPRAAPLRNALNPLQSLITRTRRPEWICQTCQNRGQPWPRRTLSSSSSPTTKTPTDPDAKPYYVTTPIFYVNAAPHVGHMYTMVLADVLKRWQELHGRRAILLTGTDEHGMKIQRAAAKAGVAPKEFCDSGAEVFRSLASQVDLSQDVFMRTTDERHKQGVEYAWLMLRERGYIYESKHEGWYSVSDETFYPPAQVQLVVDPPTGRKMMASVETGKEVEWTSERNYHFRLSGFRERLLNFYAQNPNYVVPSARMEDVVRHVHEGLEDLSISRPTERLSWGVRVPDDPSQTIYVWLDALLNYATAIGYPFTPGRETASGWPPDVQVVGKDIIRFHCVYWPAFLMALDLPVHKQVLTHAHWTLGKEKMAKSTGNVVDPFFALERFGTDAMRWYLILDGGIVDDAAYDNTFIIAKYKKGLHGGLGNLTSRIMRGKGWDVSRAVKRYAHPGSPAQWPSYDDLDTLPRRQYGLLRAFPTQVDAFMQDLLPNRALQNIMRAVYNTNAFLQEASPWNLAAELRALAEKDSAEGQQAAGRVQAEVDRTVYLSAEALRLVGILMQPFIPASAKRLLDMLGVAEDRRSFGWAVVGADDSYGVPMVDLGRGEKGVLFSPLTSDF